MVWEKSLRLKTQKVTETIKSPAISEKFSLYKINNFPTEPFCENVYNWDELEKWLLPSIF